MRYQASRRIHYSGYYERQLYGQDKYLHRKRRIAIAKAIGI